jgi:MFS family permease
MSALVRERSAYAAVVTGMLALSFCVFATTAWAPTFLVRVHGFSPAQAGRFTGLAALVCAVLGVFAIGLIVDRLQRRRSDAVIVVSMALAIGIVAVIGLAACVDDAALSAALLCASYALLGAPTVLSGTALQQMSSERHRAQVGALYVLLVNLASLSLGPTAVALFSDHVFLAPKALGLSLLSANAIACAVALVAFAAARRPFARLRERQLREGATSLEQR